MRGGYTGRGRGGFGSGAAIGAVGAGMAAGAMMAGSRQPPPRYPPSGPDNAAERFTLSEEYPVAMGPPLTVGTSQQYIDENERRFDARSPSVYTQAEGQQGAYGARAQSPARDRTSPYGSRVQSPASTVRRPSPPPAMPPLPINQAVEMDGTSTQDWNPRRSQSQDPYIPPRANWSGAAPNQMGQPRSPGRYGPPLVEGGGYSNQPRRPRVNSGGSDVYYEDVDPRFASDPEPPIPPIPQHSVVPGKHPAPPALLTAGNPGHPGQYRPESYGEIPLTHSYEELPGARSPAESETSNFTSVSQRGVNPNWKPGNGGEFSSLGPMRRRDNQNQMRQDMLLAGNPDFELPGAMVSSRPMRGRGGGPGMRGGMMGGGRGPPRIPPASAVGMGGDGAYPVMAPPLPGSSPGPGMGGGMREI